METTTHNTLSGKDSAHNLSNSKLSRIGFTMTMAAATLCGLLFAGSVTSSVAQAQTSYSEAVKQHPDWAQMPGELIRRDCVHEIPKGATLEFAKDGSLSGNVTLHGELIAHYDACPEKAIVIGAQNGNHDVAEAAEKEEAVGNGWVEDDQWNAPLASNDSIDYLAGNWTVPAYPKNVDTQVLYLANGIGNSTGKLLLENALEYGYNGAFGGQYYTISTFLITTTNVYYSVPEYVNPGDSLSAAIQMTGVSGNYLNWESLIVDNTSGAWTENSYWTTGAHWTMAYAGILKAFNLYTCAEFPASGRETFSNTVVTHGFPYYYELYPNWKGNMPGYGGPSCHFAVVAASATLDF